MIFIGIIKVCFVIIFSLDYLESIKMIENKTKKKDK